jgi:Flp pilus assembly protein TadG
MQNLRDRPFLKERGATVVEFAFVATAFLLLLIGIMDFGRWLFTLNAVAEATRWGARLAVVCTKDAAVAAIKDKMQIIAGTLTDANIVINYLDDPPAAPNTCTQATATCKRIEVTITGATFDSIIPFVNLATIPIPPFTTTLPRESMESTNNDLICAPPP